MPARTKPENAALEVSVRHTKELLERQAAELDLRYGPARELAMNGIQAVEHVGEGSVRWTVTELNGARKLTLVDTGCGMTVDQTRWLVEFGTSGQNLAARANIGAGFKLMAVAVSPAGVRYRTYTAGAEHGTEVLFAAPRDAVPGFQRLRAGSAEASWWLPVSWEQAPDEIRSAGHGTEVILIGGERDTDSTRPPDAADGALWLRRALNTRFFSLPPGIKMIVAAPLEADPDEAAQLDALGQPDREVVGQRRWLEEWSVDHGRVRLSHATAHWWILNDRRSARRRQAQLHLASGHAAALFQDELYDVLTGTRGGFDRLAKFGVRAGAERVVVYVEPDAALVQPNTARSRLLLDPNRPASIGGRWKADRELPWQVWATEFSEALPLPISKLQQADAEGLLDATTLRKSLATTLAGSSTLRRLSTFRSSADAGRSGLRPRPRSPQGAVPEPSDSATAPDIGIDGPPETALGPDFDLQVRPKMEQTRTGGLVLGGVEPTEAELAERELADVGEVVDRILSGGREAPPPPRLVRAPEVDDVAIPEWISLADGTRAPGELDDRAAGFDEASGRLRINTDFRLLADLEAAWLAAYRHLPDNLVRPLVRQLLRTGWYERLARALWTLQQLSASSGWDEQHRARAVSPEALTAAVADRSQIDAILRQRLAQKLGPAP